VTPEQARQLLDRLRMRTEQRGATAGEAAAAATLAERIIRRYGLDDYRGGGTSRESHVMGCNRLPSWAACLAAGICHRFGCTGQYTRCRGERTTVVFEGAEHAVRVACWLFGAVVKDLDRLARSAALEAQVVGGDGVRWKNRFRLGAAIEVSARLNPVPLRDMTRRADECEEGPRKPVKPIRNKRELLRAIQEQTAYAAGAEAGRRLQLETAVIGDRTPERLRLEGVR
jgi:hypothetical protein